MNAYIYIYIYINTYSLTPVPPMTATTTTTDCDHHQHTQVNITHKTHTHTRPAYTPKGCSDTLSLPGGPITTFTAAASTEISPTDVNLNTYPNPALSIPISVNTAAPLIYASLTLALTTPPYISVDVLPDVIRARPTTVAPFTDAFTTVAVISREILTIFPPASQTMTTGCTGNGVPPYTMPSTCR